MNEIEQFISDHDLPPEVVDYLHTHDTLRVAWDNCRRGDWLHHLLIALNAPHRLIVHICCHLARYTPLPDGGVVWDIVPEESKRAIELNEAWTFDLIAKSVAAAARKEALVAVELADVHNAISRQWQAQYIRQRVPWFMVALLITAWEDNDASD